MGILVIVGFFLVISQSLTSADNSGSVSISAIVQAPAPTVGAVITAPATGTTIVNSNPTQVSGTCLPASSVVVYDNKVLAGSTICTDAGIFKVSIQLSPGSNSLKARNYDNLNQAGPNTGTIVVTYTSTDPITEVAAPTLPDNPVAIAGVTTASSTSPVSPDCDQYPQTSNLPTGGQPHVTVVCVPRAIAANQAHKVGVLVWGGQPPYALNFKWGSNDSSLISMNAPGYTSVNVHYASSGVYSINIDLTDNTSKVATGESAVQVTGGATASQPIPQVINNILGTAWFQTPVPLYLSAVGVTLGFWGGDIFNRVFGARFTRRIASRRPYN